MATRSQSLQHSGNLPIRPTQSGYLRDLRQIPKADNRSSDHVLQKGHVFYYMNPGLVTTSYGLCSLMKDKSKLFFICFNKPKTIIDLPSNSTEYTFFSELPPTNFNSVFPKVFKKTDCYLIDQLLKRNWDSHSNTPFISISFFLYSLISASANSDAILKVLKCIHRINWGFIDPGGNTYLHSACIHPKNENFMQVLITRMNTNNTRLINFRNNDGMTPLAVLTQKILSESLTNSNESALTHLLKGGARILIYNEINKICRSVVDQITIGYFKDPKTSQEQLAFWFDIYKPMLSANYSVYALVTDPTNIQFTRTDKLFLCSSEYMIQKLKENFKSILSLNCPQILDYIFSPQNKLLIKSDKSMYRDSLLHIAAQYCNSNLLFSHFISDVTDWRIENLSGENVLHSCVLNKQYGNFGILLEKIPPSDFNRLLFSPNSQNVTPFNIILGDAAANESIKLVIKKDCHDSEENNIAQIAILLKNINLLILILEITPESYIFTYKNKKSLNSLQLAVENQYKEAVELLVDLQDRSILTSLDNTGRNILHIALLNYNNDVFKLILGAVVKFVQNCPENAKLINSRVEVRSIFLTPFLLSIQEKNFQATQLLVANGARVDLPDSINQCYPSYIQRFCKSKVEIVRMLAMNIDLRNFPKLPVQYTNIQDLDFEGSPLMFNFYAYSQGETFLEFCDGFSFKNIIKPNKEGSTLLHLALGSDHDWLVEYFLNRLTLPDLRARIEINAFIDKKNNQYETALYISIKKSKVNTVKRLLNMGASVEIEYPGGNTILHIAINTRNTEIIQILLGHQKIGQLYCKANEKAEIPIISLMKIGGIGAIDAINRDQGTSLRGPNGESILHLVVKNGDKDTLEAILKVESVKALFTVRDNEGQTPLHYAVILSKIYAIGLLVEQGFNISEQDNEKKTPIHYAIDAHNVEVWKAIMGILSQYQRLQRLIDQKDSSGLTLLQYSIECNFLTAVQDILTLRPNLCPDHPEKNTIVHLAAKSAEKAEILNYILEYIKKEHLSEEERKKLFESNNQEQLPPLHYAIYHDNIEGVKIILRQGFSIVTSFKGEKSFFSGKLGDKLVLCQKKYPKANYLFGYKVKSKSETLLILTEISSFQSIELLQENSVTIVNSIAEDAVPIFLQTNCSDIINYLIQHKIIKSTSTFSNGATLLHYAAQFSSQHILLYLISKHGVSPTVLDKQNNSLLYYALQNANSDVLGKVGELLNLKENKKPTNLFEIPNSEGKRILEVCLLNNFKGFSIILPYISDLIYLNVKKLNLLHLIIQNDQAENFISPFIEVLIKRYNPRRLSEYVNTTATSDTLTALHCSILSNNFEIVSLVLKLNPDLSITNSKGYNAIHLATLKGNTSIIELLLTHIANIKLANHNLIDSLTSDTVQISPLHISVINGNNEILNLLLLNKARPYIVNANGQTILHYAVSNHKIPENTLKLIIATLLKYPLLISMQDNLGQTPVMCSVINCNLTVLTMFLEYPTDIDLNQTDKNRKNLIHLSIECKTYEIWKTLFPYLMKSNFFANLTVKSPFNLIDSLLLCMKSKNEMAFKDLLGLNPKILISDSNWRNLIESSIVHSDNIIYLTTIILHLKTNQPNSWKESCFYPQTIDFTPPLQLAIQQGNIKAIETMLTENISLSFLSSNNQLSLYSQANPKSLVICQNIRSPSLLLIGYKISISRTVYKYILVDLPRLDNTKLYSSREISVLQTLSNEDIITILRSPSIEPIISILLPSYTLQLNRGCELIHLAAQYGSHQIIQHLLFTQNLTKLDENKNSILFYALLHQTSNIFQTICNYLVKIKSYNLFNIQNVFGNRILDICIERKDFESFSLLLDSKYNVELDYVDSRGYYLFHRIILRRADIKFFSKLHSVFLSHNLYTNLIGIAAGPSNLTPLHLAIVEHLHDYIAFMLKHSYDLCVKSKCGNSPLHLAILYNSDEETYNLILNAIPKDKLYCCINEQNNHGYTPLHLAAQNGNINTVKVLLSKSGVQKEMVDSLHRTTLHHAVLLRKEEFDPELVHLLLHDTDLHNYEDNTGRTPVHYCVSQSNLKALEEIFERKKDININDKDNEGKNIFHLAIENKVSLIWNRIFAELKACPHYQSIIEETLDNKTLLVYCIMHNNITAFKDLLSLVPNISTRDSQRNTPLHHAGESPEQSELLILLKEYIEKFHKERIQDIFCYQNEDNLTPLHYAIKNNNVTAIQTLLHISPFVFSNKQQQLTLCALNSPLSLKLCKLRSNGSLMIGYKTVLENKITSWILTTIPDMVGIGIECKDSEITEITKIDKVALKTVLECPSSEPLIAFLDRNLISKDYTFTDQTKINSYSLLHYAAMHGSLEVVTELCNRINIFAPDSNGDSVLFYALSNPQASVLEFLIKKIIELNKNKSPGIDLLNATNKSGERLLEVALEKKHYDAFIVLLKIESKIELTYKDANDSTLLHKIVRNHKEAKYLASLLSEIKRREPNTLCTYVNYPIPVTLSTALHLCISEHQEECLRSLIQFSPNLTCEDSEGNSPLHLASENNYRLLIQILIDHVKGVDGDLPSFLNTVNIQKLTPLHYAIIHFNSDTVKLLLTEGANLYAINQSGQSVLHLAVQIKHLENGKEAIKFLLDYERGNPNPDNSLIRVQDNSGHTPLHVAVMLNKIGATQLLLAESPDLAIVDKDQMTVLHHSIRKNYYKIFDKTLEAIVSKNSTDPLHVLNLKDRNGNTAINLAIDVGVEESIDALLQLNPLLNLKDNSGQTPLHLAVLKPMNILECILVKINTSFQTEKTAYLIATNNEGLPPLHFAILKNRLESVEKLINFGAKLSHTDDKEFTTLYNGKGGLSLCFSKAKKGLLSFFSKDTIFVGYKMFSKGKWIVTNLPELTKTTIVFNSQVEEFTKPIPDASVLNIIECACIEPIEVAIQNVLVDQERKEGKGKWLHNLASKKGHKNVCRYLCKNLPIEALCTMVRSGVTNSDTFEDTLDYIPSQHNYQRIPKLTDFSSEEEILIYNISTTLCETMCLSLDNIANDALTKLLALNPCLNFIYPEGNGTLLHLMMIKEKSSDFLEIFLKKVFEIEPGNQEVTIDGVRIIDAKNENSLTALSLSIKMEQEENIKMLLKYKPDLTLCDELNNSILHFAAKTCNVAIVELIIAEILESPNLNYLFNAGNSDGCIPLHNATETGHLAICEQLLANGSELFSRDKALRSILHHAILIQREGERTSMIEFILNNAKNGKIHNNIVELEDAHGQLPIHFAVTRKCLASLKLLILYSSTIKYKDAKGQTILHLTSIYGDDINKNIISCILTEILKQEESNPNSEWVTDRVVNFQDNCQKTPLHLCIDKRNHACLLKLLTAQPNLDLVDATKNTLLHTAVEVVEDIRYLESILSKIPIESLSDFFTRLNSQGLPPLQYAIFKNNFLAAEVLVKKKATLAFQSDGRTHICGENGKLTLEIVPHRNTSWAGFRILAEYLVITDLADLKNTIFLNQTEARSIKPYRVLTTQIVKQISECQCCDPLKSAIQIGLIKADTKLSDGLNIAPIIAKNGTKEVMKIFYEIHKDTLYFEKSGNSLIESAVENPNVESLELLLSYLPSSLQQTEQLSREISSCVKNSLKLSLKNPNTGGLNALLSYSNKINYLYTEDKLTLLHMAIQEQRSTDLLNAIFTKVNAIGTECAFGSVLFINKQSETSKQTALHTCIQLKKKDTLNVLLANSPDIFICDVDGNTALHFAVLHSQDLNYVEMLHEFTQEKQKLLNIRNNNGHSALHLAVIGGNLGIVKFLLSSNAEFYPQTLNEPTLLHLAIKIEDDSIRGDVIEALLPYKNPENIQCEMTRLKDNSGYPPLHLAVRLRTKNAVKLLLNADPSVLLLKNKDGHTPLHISLIPQTVGTSSELPYCEIIFNEVLGVIMSCSEVEACTTCQVNKVICTQDNHERTAMHYAIQYNNVEALTTLLTKKTCLNIPDHDGNILLHESVKNLNDITCLKLVMEELELRYKDYNFLDCFKF